MDWVVCIDKTEAETCFISRTSSLVPHSSVAQPSHFNHKQRAFRCLGRSGHNQG
ncbi:hypothetical protein [Vibrio sp. 10N.286.51.C3]|uniref:hypothetical protein n=1 Tax=Vibrio sp. 10N.286.51.C3 TaxID=2056190 RepID=UPI0015E75705|nr:hypothetical protein [Vibrio sp. 10N.286.51.C3]